MVYPRFRSSCLKFDFTNDATNTGQKQASSDEPMAQKWSWCNATSYLVHNSHGMYAHATQQEGDKIIVSAFKNHNNLLD